MNRFVVCALLIFSSACRKEAEQPTPAQLAAPVSSAPREQAEWPDIPYEPIRYGHVPEVLPTMLRLNIDPAEASDLNSPNHHLLVERLRTLITENVAPMEVKELDDLMRSHEIRYVMDPSLGPAAGFFTRKGIPHLRINARSLAEIDNPDAIVVYMLVIVHEFTHYKQWKKTTSSLMKATMDEGFNWAMNDEVCTIMWQGEREAYHTQCWFANGYGIAWNNSDPKADYCVRMNSEAAFNQAFYYARMRDSSPGMRETCKERWWDLAGGPR